MKNISGYDYYKSLDKLTIELDTVLGNFDYLQYQIQLKIEELTELHGEVCERAENIARALDLNRKTMEHPDNCQCYECKMAQADADVCQAMSRRERLEQQIEKEKENAKYQS